MNLRQIACLLICITALLFVGCASKHSALKPLDNRGTVLLLSHERSAVWAKTGDTLYYRDDGGTLWQLDGQSGSRTSLDQLPADVISWDYERVGKEVPGQSDLTAELVSADGSVMLCSGNNNYYLYDVAEKTKKALPSKMVTGTPVYLSRNIYVQTSSTRDTLTVVSFRTGESEDIAVSEVGNTMRLSPSFRHYWVAHHSIGEWNKGELRLVRVPQKSQQILRKMDAR